jgi:divalent metal cation (Fe/Co/Zn/Cd) transporter
MEVLATNPGSRITAVQSGKRLEYFTIVWHLAEGGISVLAGVVAGSLALVGFGVDSLIELVSGVAVLWRMSVDHQVDLRERNEKRTLKFIGWSFIALAVYLIFEAIMSFAEKKAPERSPVGIAIAVLSLVVMPLVSRAKRQIGTRLHSPAMNADAKQADFCAYLAAILLAGLLLNYWLNWWWADPVAALGMALIIANEGINASFGQANCCDAHRRSL